MNNLSKIESNPSIVPLNLVEWLPSDNAARGGRLERETWEAIQANEDNLVDAGWLAAYPVPVYLPEKASTLEKKLHERRKVWWDSLSESQKKILYADYHDSKGNLLMPTYYALDGNGRSTVLPRVQERRATRPNAPLPPITEIPVWQWEGEESLIPAVQNSVNLFTQNAAQGHSAQTVYDTLRFFDWLSTRPDGGQTATPLTTNMIAVGNKKICPRQLAGSAAQRLGDLLKINTELRRLNGGDFLAAVYKGGTLGQVPKGKGSSEKKQGFVYGKDNVLEALLVGAIPIHTGPLTQASAIGTLRRCVFNDKLKASEGEYYLKTVGEVVEWIKGKIVKPNPTNSEIVNAVENVGNLVPDIGKMLSDARKGTDVTPIARKLASQLAAVDVAKEYLTLHNRAKSAGKETAFFDYCKNCPILPTAEPTAETPAAETPAAETPAAEDNGVAKKQRTAAVRKGSKKGK